MTLRGLFGFAVAIAACGVIATASAQDVPRAQSGSWTIAPIANSNMCSMKNTWDDGRKLVFARDTAGVNSVALDFGAAKLEAGRQYPMALDLPPLLTRDAVAVAATRNVLLVGMGKDRAFYDALARMQALYVTTLGQETGYDLSGSADALRELADCSDRLGGKAPARVAVKEVPARKQAAAPKKSAARHAAAIQPAAGGLSGQVAALEKKLAAAEEDRKRLKAALAKADLAQAEAAALEMERDALHERLEKTKRAGAAQAALEKERDALKKKLAAVQKAEAAEAAELEGRLARLESERNALRRDLAAARDARDAEKGMEARLGKIEAERDGLRAELAVVQKQKDKASAAAVEKEELARRVSVLEDQLVAEARRARAAEAGKARLESGLAGVSAALEDRKPSAHAAAVAAAPAREDRLARILGSSGVVSPQEISTRDGDGARLYQWRAGDVLGSAEETGMQPGESFRGKVSAWIDRMAGACKDDFAFTEAVPRSQSGLTVQTAEAACIGARQSAAAALVFIGDGERFAAVMHETATEAMPAALSQRDAVASAAR